ncbi:MAG: T9SS type B sorting domain-containing protein [Saprospiraceae bacterium]
MRILLTYFFILPTVLVFSQKNAACDLDIGPDALVCNNAVFSLNPNPVPGNYSWIGPANLSCTDCPTPQVTGLTTGVYTFIATVVTPDCMDTDTLTVTVINGEAPQFTISSDREVCAGDSVHLGGPAVPGTFYNWFSVPSGFGSFLSDPPAVPSLTTTYYLSVSNASCPLPMLDSVTITPVSISIQITPNTDTLKICRGRSRVLQVTVTPSGLPLVWSPDTGLTISGNGTSVVASPLVSTLYTVQTAIGTCVKKEQVYFSVDTLPADLKIRPADTTLCQVAEVLLWSPNVDTLLFPGITFKWTRTPQTALLTPDSLQNLTVKPNQTTLYRRVTRYGECSDTASALVRVVPPVAFSAVPKLVSICPGDSVVLKLVYTPGVTDILWSPANGLSCTACDSVVARPGASGTYVVSGKNQDCPLSDTVQITVLPLAPLLFPANKTICLGDTITLNGLFDPTAKYTWTSTHPGFGTDTVPNPQFRPSQSATYFVMTNNGCIGRDSVRIEVETATLTLSNDTTICKGNSATITAMTNIPGTGFQWVDAATGQPVGTNRVLAVMPAQTTQYVALFAYGNGCQLADTVTVTVSGEVPQIVFPDPVERQLCPSESLLLNLGSVLPGASYTWSATPADTTLVPMDPSPDVSPSRNTTYTVTAILGNCKTMQTVDVFAYSATLFATADTILCAENSVTLTAQGSDPLGRFTWDSGETAASILKSPASDTSFIVTYTYGDTCTIRDTVFVDWVPNFDLQISCLPDTNALDIGVPVALFAVVSPPQNLTGFTFMWQETTVDTKTLPFTTESIEVVPGTNDTLGAFVRYILTVTSKDGCVQIVEKTFSLIFPKIGFPNAFTPDNDGNNDTFEMILFEGNAYVERMEIYNRWGGLVFESNDTNASWDGTFKGERVPSDVYVYKVVWRRGDGALQPVAVGDVTVLR